MGVLRVGAMPCHAMPCLVGAAAAAAAEENEASLGQAHPHAASRSRQLNKRRPSWEWPGEALVLDGRTTAVRFRGPDLDLSVAAPYEVLQTLVMSSVGRWLAATEGIPTYRMQILELVVLHHVVGYCRCWRHLHVASSDVHGSCMKDPIAAAAEPEPEPEASWRRLGTASKPSITSSAKESRGLLCRCGCGTRAGRRGAPRGRTCWSAALSMIQALTSPRCQGECRSAFTTSQGRTDKGGCARPDGP